MTIPQPLATPHVRASLPIAETTTAPVPPPLICPTCRSAAYLVIEQVTAVSPQGSTPAAWDIECWCGKCEEFLGIRTTSVPEMPHSRLMRGYGTGT